MCWDQERWSTEASRQERDLDEVRRLFARYRRVARAARLPEVEHPVKVEAKQDEERTPVGVGG